MALKKWPRTSNDESLGDDPCLGSRAEVTAQQIFDRVHDEVKADRPVEFRTIALVTGMSETTVGVHFDPTSWHAQDLWRTGSKIALVSL